MKTNLTKAAKVYLDSVRALIIVLDRSGRIRYINSYAAGVLGYPAGEMVGQDWFRFVPREQRKELKKQFREYLKDKERMGNNQNFVETRAGDLHLVEWQDVLLQDKEGKVIGSLVSGEDITEKHILKLYLAELQTRFRQENLTTILEAAERERQFLAYELHDGVNQVLTTCKLLLESELSVGTPSANVERTYKYLQEVINTLRELSHELNPAEMGNEGLYQAAQELVQRINDTGRVVVTATVTGMPELQKLPRTLSLNLYRMMQEALNNIVKHAGASKVDIRLTGSADAVDLEIEDNGKGFDRSKKSPGLGLKAIYTRAEAAGGKAHIGTVPGEGTLLSVHIPVDFSEVKPEMHATLVNRKL